MDQQPVNRPKIPIEVLQRLKIYLSNTANLIQLQDLDPSTLFTTAEIASDKMCLISELFATNIQEKGNFNLTPIYDLHREEHLQLLNKINFSIHLKLQAFNQDSFCIALARVGMHDQVIKSGKMQDFIHQIHMGPPLHSFIICSQDLHPIEKEMYDYYL